MNKLNGINSIFPNFDSSSTKRMRSKPKLISLLMFTLISSCNSINKQAFDAKPIIGIFGDNQGMVTFEGNLYADSSFYIPESPLMDEAAGRFFMRGNVITFIQSEGQFYFDTLHLSFDTLKPPYQNMDPDGEINYVVFRK